MIDFLQVEHTCKCGHRLGVSPGETSTGHPVNVTADAQREARFPNAVTSAVVYDIAPCTTPGCGCTNFEDRALPSLAYYAGMVSTPVPDMV